MYKDYSYYRLSDQDSFIYDASGNNIETIYYADSAGIIKYAGKDSTQYNSYNRPTFYKSSFYPSKVFYYEVYVPTGISKANTNATIKVYPNPAQNTLNITCNQLEHAKFILADMMGKTVAICLLKDTGATHIDISYLPPGIYCYKVTKGVSIIGTGKVLKE